MLIRCLFVVVLISNYCQRSYSQESAETDTDRKKSYFGQPPPGPAPELFAPGYFSNQDGYHSPVVFNEALTEAYWSPMEYDHCLMYALRAEGSWSPPGTLTAGLEKGIGDPFISPDGKRLYFLSFESPEGSSGPERERIWYADKVGGDWGKAVCLDPVLSEHPTHWKGSVSDGGTLYFTSEINMETSKQDIYFATFKDGRFTSPRSVGQGINTHGWEFGPCISPDESFLIFTRRDDKTRKTDLYVSCRSEEGSWNTALELGPGINSDENDLCPALSPDGKYLFFLSTRDGTSRIYWVDIGDTLRSLNRRTMK